MTFSSPRLAAFSALMTVFAVPSCVDRTLLQTEASIDMTSTAYAEKPMTTPAEAMEVVAFWREAGPSMWFAKDDAFDTRFRTRFLVRHEAAARGELKSWEQTSDGVLALILLLDQFPRNAFRGTPRMYATDAMARDVADRAILAGLDKSVDPQIRTFVYLPFGHSENLADQERSVALSRTQRVITTSSRASAASRIATPFSGARCGRRNRTTSTRAATPVEAAGRQAAMHRRPPRYSLTSI